MSSDFAGRLLAWFDQYGRHDLPWQQPRTAYRVWVSEVMLQQTRVGTVVGYFERFMAALPDLPALAMASEDRVLALWSGLGYYSRALNLRRAAGICVARHQGELPDGLDALMALPGIGRSTAAAILAQAHGQRLAILDGNVKRVLARHAGIDGYPGTAAVEQALWQLAEARLPEAAYRQRMADYTQAIMDLGATLCTRSRPRCGDCPLSSDCVARTSGRCDQWPTRKPARVVPERAALMLVAIDSRARVLLERRPGLGVWRGLWSLPEVARPLIEDPASAVDALLVLAAGQGLASFAAATASVHVLPAFAHGFTHFRLHIRPYLLRVQEAIAGVAEADHRRWVTPDELADLGLPAPVRSLLARVLSARAETGSAEHQLGMGQAQATKVRA